MDEVIGTVLYPTEEVLTFLHYSAPLTKAELLAAAKPMLVVDTLVETVQAATISEVTRRTSLSPEADIAPEQPTHHDPR